MTLLAEPPARQAMTRTPRPESRQRGELQLAALPTAVVCAQLFAEYTLQEWQLADLIANAKQIVTALVANAVRTTGINHPRPRWIELHDLQLILVRLQVLAQGLVIEVADTEP